MNAALQSRWRGVFHTNFEYDVLVKKAPLAQSMQQDRFQDVGQSCATIYFFLFDVSRVIRWLSGTLDRLVSLLVDQEVPEDVCSQVLRSTSVDL